MQNDSCSIAVLVSGGGSNLQSIIDHIQQGHINANISCVISNKADAYGLERAKQANIPAHIVNHKNYTSCELFENELLRILNVYKVTLVVLAGFMRVLSNTFIDEYQGRILNIHPSLLPKYPGLHTHERVLNAGDTEHGCSVHFVTADLDGGPLIIQAHVPVTKTDNSKSLAERVLKKEHIIYPLAIKWFCENKVTLKNEYAYFENKQLKQAIKLTRVHEHELQ